MMSTPVRPIEREPISAIVAARLEQLIFNGEYQGQGQLPSERVLAEQFDVSRSSIREAMRRLEAKGLVRVQHGAGVFVTTNGKQPTPDAVTGLVVLGKATVPALFEVRNLLECRAAALASRRLTDSGAQKLQNILTKLDDEGLTDDEYIQLDFALHYAIAEATKNRILTHIFNGLRDPMIEYASRIIKIPRRRANATLGHQAIVDAIVAKRPSAARKAMAEHLRLVEQDIIDSSERTQLRSAGPG